MASAGVRRMGVIAADMKVEVGEVQMQAAEQREQTESKPKKKQIR